MRTWSDSTFVFLSTNQNHDVGGVEERWLLVMGELCRLGATVHYLCLSESPTEQPARALGVEVTPYILDKWNPVRARSRLRKYLRRYVPVCAHSTGLEADLILRWSARRVPEVEIAHTLPAGDQQPSRRRPSLDALMRRFDETGMRTAAAVFVESTAARDEVLAAHVVAERVILDPPGTTPADQRESVARHIALYRELMAHRGHDA